MTLTYASLGGIVLLGALVVFNLCWIIAARRGTLPPRFGRAVLAAGIVLTTMTIFFDSLMIAAELVSYESVHLTGIYVWLTPIEDLAWPVAAVLVLPAVWVAMSPRPVPGADPSNTTHKSKESQ